MKTPGVSIFVVVVLVLGVALAFYDYSKHGAREEQGKISKYEAYKLKNTKLLGAEESYKGDYEKAIKDYKAALKIAPRDAYLHNDLGTAYYYLGLKSINPPIKEDEFEFGIEVDARHLKKSEVLPKVKEALNKTDSGIITVVMVDQDAKDEVVAFAQSLKYIVNVEEEKREKTFLLRMPYSLWMEAKKRALEEEMTLHDFILKCIKESVQSS